MRVALLAEFNLFRDSTGRSSTVGRIRFRARQLLCFGGKKQLHPLTLDYDTK